MHLRITSPAFTHQSSIPPQYTCNGENFSPALSWEGAPKGTKSFVLIVDDPDAPHGTWDHWVLFNVPSDLTSLAEAAEVPAGATSGLNSWDNHGYGGPCPPDGKHRYYFTLYALDTLLDLHPNVYKHEVLKAMEGHVLESAQLMGTYQQPTMS